MLAARGVLPGTLQVHAGSPVSASSAKSASLHATSTRPRDAATWRVHGPRPESIGPPVDGRFLNQRAFTVSARNAYNVSARLPCDPGGDGTPGTDGDDPAVNPSRRSRSPLASSDRPTSSNSPGSVSCASGF